MKFRMIALTVVSLFSITAARAADVKVLASGAVKGAFLALGPMFEAETGNNLVVTWAGSAQIRTRVVGGDYDLIVTTAADIDTFAGTGVVSVSSVMDLMKVGVGVAVKAGAAKPDISDADGVRKALLAARGIGYSGGPSGAYILTLIERLGIADDVKAKLKQAPAGEPVARSIADGRVDIGFQQVSELIHEPGITLLGPLPAEIQNVTVFGSAVRTGAHEPAAAKALQKFLTAPTSDFSIRENGLEPARR